MYLEHLAVFSVVNYFLKPMVKDIDLVLQIKVSLRKEGTRVLFYQPSLWAARMPPESLELQRLQFLKYQLTQHSL